MKVRTAYTERHNQTAGCRLLRCKITSLHFPMGKCLKMVENNKAKVLWDFKFKQTSS